MSMAHFQMALAKAIRGQKIYDFQYFDNIFNSNDLSLQEKEALKDVFNKPLVNAYSDDLANIRWRMANQLIDFLYIFIPEDKVKEAWNKFDKENLSIPEFDLSIKFLEFLSFNKDFIPFIEENGPEYLIDIVRYLYCINYFSDTKLIDVFKPSKDSLLKTGKFKLITINFDIRNICEKILLNKENGDLNYYKNFILKKPKKKKLNILFLSKKPTKFRSFEIDDETFGFLSTEMKNPKDRLMPKSYADLVNLRLCKEL